MFKSLLGRLIKLDNPQIKNKNHRDSQTRFSQFLKKSRFVVFDLETTGFDTKNDSIIAIGAVAVDQGMIKNKEIFYSLVKPSRPIPPVVEDLTGINNNLVKNASEPLKAVQEFLNFAGSSVLVAHQADFDLSFINRILKSNNKCLTNICLDTKLIAQKLFPTIDSYRLENLLQLFSLPAEGRHCALGDAFLAAQLLTRFLTILDERKISNLINLMRYINHPHLN